MESEPELLTDEEILAEIEDLRQREWDLLDQIHEARITRAALMNLIKERHDR